MAPDIGQVAGYAGEGDDVDGGFDGSLGDEEEGHPEEVEAELDGVEGCALLEENMLFGGGEGVQASVTGLRRKLACDCCVMIFGLQDGGRRYEERMIWSLLTR